MSDLPTLEEFKRLTDVEPADYESAVYMLAEARRERDTARDACEHLAETNAALQEACGKMEAERDALQAEVARLKENGNAQSG